MTLYATTIRQPITPNDPRKRSINWNHPITNGLVYAWHPPYLVDLVHSIPLNEEIGITPVTKAVDPIISWTPTAGHYITVNGSMSFIDGSSYGTIAGWVRRIGVDGTAMGIEFFNTSTFCRFGFFIVTSVLSGACENPDFGRVKSYSVGSNDGRIHHYALTFDGTLAETDRLQLYVDAVSVGAMSGGGSVGTTVQTTEGFALHYNNGQQGGSQATHYGPVQAWNRTLSPAEVFSLYNSQTCWDLYQQPSRRVYFSVGPAPTKLILTPY